MEPARDNITSEIARLNDQLRQTMSEQHGFIVMTPAVYNLAAESISKIREGVRVFNSFTSDNDPYGEHDFGSLEFSGDTYFWKIDCYALDMQSGSEEPANPKKTRRVLTIMHSREY